MWWRSNANTSFGGWKAEKILITVSVSTGLDLDAFLASATSKATSTCTFENSCMESNYTNENMNLSIYLFMYLYIYVWLSSNTDRQNRNVERPSKNIDFATHTPKVHYVVDDDHMRHLMVIGIRSYSHHHRMHPIIIIDDIMYLRTSIIVTTLITLDGCIVICTQVVLNYCFNRFQIFTSYHSKRLFAPLCSPNFNISLLYITTKNMNQIPNLFSMSSKVIFVAPN